MSSPWSLWTYITCMYVSFILLLEIIQNDVEMFLVKLAILNVRKKCNRYNCAAFSYWSAVAFALGPYWVWSVEAAAESAGNNNPVIGSLLGYWPSFLTPYTPVASCIKMLTWITWPTRHLSALKVYESFSILRLNEFYTWNTLSQKHSASFLNKDFFRCFLLLLPPPFLLPSIMLNP